MNKKKVSILIWTTCSNTQYWFVAEKKSSFAFRLITRAEPNISTHKVADWNVIPADKFKQIQRAHNGTFEAIFFSILYCLSKRWGANLMLMHLSTPNPPTYIFHYWARRYPIFARLSFISQPPDRYLPIQNKYHGYLFLLVHQGAGKRALRVVPFSTTCNRGVIFVIVPVRHSWRPHEIVR